MKRSLAALALVAILSLSACGSNDDTANPDPPSEGDVLVHFTSGGGFAVHLRELIVNDDGSGLVFGTDTKPVSFELGENELTDLRETLEAHPASDLDPDTDNTYCADCFTYSLAYGGGQFSGDEVSLSDEAMELVGEVSSIADAHATGPPDPDSRLVRYVAAGGLGGDYSALRIENDGSAVLERRGGLPATRGGRVDEFIVPFDRVQDLRGVLLENPAGELGPGFDPNCMDCPSLSLSYGGESFDTNSPELDADTKRVTGLLDAIVSEQVKPESSPSDD